MAAPDTNGSVVPFRELSAAEVKELTSRPKASVFDPFDRLFPAYNVSGKRGTTVFDLGQGDAQQLKEMLRTNAQARKVEQVLTLPIRSAAWTIRPAPGGDREYRWVKEQLESKLDRVIDQMTTALTFRKAFFELSYSLNDAGDGVTVTEVGFRPATGCEQGHDPDTGKPCGFRQRKVWPTGFYGDQFRSGGAPIQANPKPDSEGSGPGYEDIDEGRSFVFVHGAYREPIEGLSELDVCWWGHETIRKIQFLWFQYLEQQSLPKLLVYGPDQGTADRNADAVAEAKASGVIAYEYQGDGTQRAFDVLESSGKGAAQFLEAINYIDGQMSASVLASFTDLAGISARSRTGSGGSYALSADQSEFFLAARQAVADEMAEAISTDLFGKLCALEFGHDCKPPTIEIGPLSKRDKDRALSLLMSMMTADRLNAPPKIVDLLWNATAGYVGLPVDQVAKAVEEHPARDPAEVAAQLKQQASTPAPDVPGERAPVGEGDQSVADTSDPAAVFRQLTGLAHGVDEFVRRTHSGEHPALVVADLTGRPAPRLTTSNAQRAPSRPDGPKTRKRRRKKRSTSR